VNHSVHGEFAYRNGPWKLVFKMPKPTIAQSRGKEAVAELYNLDDDIAEINDVAKQHPEEVRVLTNELQRCIDRGRSTPGIPQRNDAQVRFDVIPTERWAPAFN
jgi:arylsulfatase A-like enzyme